LGQVSAEQAHAKGFRKYDKRGSVTLVGAEPFPPTSGGSFEGLFARQGSDPKKLQEFDERWFDAHKIEARLARWSRN